MALSVAVIGGSIGGLAAATVLHQLGARVRVFEASPTSFETRGSSIGYCNVQFWESIRGERMLRRGQQAHRNQGAFFYGDLWAFWAQGLPPGTITFNTTVTDLGPDPFSPRVGGETFDLAIIADGGWSSLRTRYFGPEAPEYAGWQAWRFRVPREAVPGFQTFGEFTSGHFAAMILDVCQDDGTDLIAGGVAIAAPESEVVRPAPGGNRQAAAPGGAPQPGANPPVSAAAALEGPGRAGFDFLPFFHSKFGRMAGGELSRVMEAAAKFGKITPNPQYEFCAREVARSRLVLVGDAAHMAVPRTAAGAHTAVLDALGLRDAFLPVARALGEGGFGSGPPQGGWGEAVDRAIAAYSGPGLRRAQELYARSVEVSKPVCAPGWKRGAVASEQQQENTCAID